MHGGWSCERSDFTRFCIIMHELVWLWDGHATFQTQNFSKHNIYNLTRNVLSSMILTLCLESEHHKTGQNTTFSADMLSLSINDFDACNEFCITYIVVFITMYILPCIFYTHHWYFFWFFSIVYVSRKIYIFDIEQTWVQFPAANSAFSEKCSAPFHAVHECFSQ